MNNKHQVLELHQYEYNMPCGTFKPKNILYFNLQRFAIEISAVIL